MLKQLVHMERQKVNQGRKKCGRTLRRTGSDETKKGKGVEERSGCEKCHNGAGKEM
jgi:hypothetical protein